MNAVVFMRGQILMPHIEHLLRNGHHVRLSVTGDSMIPFLRPQDDIELMLPSPGQIKRGVIVLAKRLDGAYVLHRISAAKPEGAYLLGDAQQASEGPLPYGSIMAVVAGMWHDNQYQCCNSCLWRFASALWLLARPFRPQILFILRRIRNLHDWRNPC